MRAKIGDIVTFIDSYDINIDLWHLMRVPPHHMGRVMKYKDTRIHIRYQESLYGYPEALDNICFICVSFCGPIVLPRRVSR